MTQLNNFIGVGRLVRDPELKETSSGHQVCNFTMALDGGFGDKKKSVFVDVTAWNKTADFVKGHFQKGKEILIQGRLDFEQWEKNGEKRSKVCIVADRAGFVGGKDDQETNSEKAPKTSPQAPSDGNGDIPF